MTAPKCPSCGEVGRVDVKGRGNASCAACGGAFAPLPLVFATLKRAGVDGARLQEILGREGKKHTPCVSCAELFTTFPVLDEPLHACVPCQAVYLAKGALDRFTAMGAANPGPVSTATMQMAVANISPPPPAPPPMGPPPSAGTPSMASSMPPSWSAGLPSAPPSSAQPTSTISMFAVSGPPPAPTSTMQMFAVSPPAAPASSNAAATMAFAGLPSTLLSTPVAPRSFASLDPPVMPGSLGLDPPVAPGGLDPPIPPASLAPIGAPASKPASSAALKMPPTSKPFNLTDGPSPPPPASASSTASPTVAAPTFASPPSTSSGVNGGALRSPPHSSSGPSPSAPVSSASPSSSSMSLDPDEPSGKQRKSDAAAARKVAVKREDADKGDKKVDRKRPDAGALYVPDSGGSPALRILLVLVLLGAVAFAGYRLIGPTPTTGIGGGKGASFGAGTVAVEPIALGARAATKLTSTSSSGELVAWYIPGSGSADPGSGELLLIEVLGKSLRLDGVPRRIGDLAVMNADVTMGEKSGRVRAFFTEKDAWILAATSTSPEFGRSREAERFLSSFANQ